MVGDSHCDDFVQLGHKNTSNVQDIGVYEIEGDT